MIFDVIIVGAGLSGTYLSRKLYKMGLKTLIVEKSNGIGGRLATKLVGTDIADYGCQYIRPMNTATKALVSEMENKNILNEITIKGSKRTFISPYGMNAIPKFLARGSNVITNELVISIKEKNKAWEVFTENFNLKSRIVILTMPITQVQQLLSNSNINDMSTPDVNYLSFYTATYRSLDNNFSGTASSTSDLPWICSNTKKGLRNLNDIYTVNLSDEISKKILKLDNSERLQSVSELLNKFGFIDLRNLRLHYWKYAFSLNQDNVDYIYNKDRQLGIIGDSFSIGQANGAVKSAEMIFQKMNQEH